MYMNKNTSTPIRRGRPPKIARENADTKALLIRTGLETLTEFGFSATGRGWQGRTAASRRSSIPSMATPFVRRRGVRGA